MSALELDDARDLLPLYVGGDLDDEAAEGVAAALEAYPELRQELARWEALEGQLTHAFTVDVAELLPLYAGDDLGPAERAEVEAALEARPELQAELASFSALEDLLARSLQPEPLSSRDARDLLPLHAGADLDPVAARQVDEALIAHPELGEELAAYRAVDARLREAYPAAAAEAPEREGGLAPLIRLQCPYCHDALQNAPVALCMECSTPHHTGCFEQNQGCSIFGCEGTQAVAKRQATLRVCGECGRHTQADAPFCAWCGTANTAARAPLHARREPGTAVALKPAEGAPSPASEPAPAQAPAARRGWAGWLRIAAAVAMTLGSLGAGLAFGTSERRRVQGWASSVAVVRLRAAEERALASLDAVRDAQRRFLLQDWDRDGVADYAESLAELRVAAHNRQAETEALLDTSWEAWFTGELSSTPPRDGRPAGFRMTLRQRHAELQGWTGWTADAEGPVTLLPPGEGGAE